MKKFYSLLILFICVMNNHNWSQSTIIGFNFEDLNTTADLAITANSSSNISSTASGTFEYPAGTPGTGTRNISIKGWDNGNGTKYWEIELATNSFGTLTVSSKQKSSPTGPRDFKLQYKIGSGGTYMDISSTSITLADDNFISGAITNASLPSDCNNQSSVYLRWIMTSNNAVNGTTDVGSTGTSRIDEISVKGVLNAHSSVSVIGTGSGTGLVSWTQATGYSNSVHTTLVFLKASNPITEGVPTNNVANYTASTAFGSGTSYQNDANAYCVYNGDGTSVNITGISDGTNYHALVLNVADPNVYSAAVTGSGLMPVELSAFSAICQGNAVNLKWQTKTEVNNYGFEIERASSLTSPIQDWTKIGFVNGHGNCNSPKDYTFTDKTVTSGKYVYRLKQIDTDGKYEFSKEVEVDLGTPKTFYLGQNYPNPFNPSTKINYSLPADGEVKLALYTLEGELVKTLVNERQNAGNYSVEFNAENLSSGMYIYKLMSNGFVQTKKMMLAK